MHGAEYDELVETLDNYKDKFETVTVAEPMLGEVGDDATVINDDKKAVAQAITDEACKEAGFDDMQAAADAMAGVNPIGDCLYFGNGNYGIQIGDHFFH